MITKLVKTTIWLIVGAASLYFIPRDAHAVGLGMSVGATTGKFGTEANNATGTGNHYYNEHKGAIGLLFDTNIGKRNLFNYRLGVAYEKVTVNLPEKEHYEGVAIENDFGFGFSTDNLRLWVGPEVRVNYNSHNLFGIGAGPAVGINVNLGNGLALCAKGAYIFSRHERFFSEDREKSASLSLGLVMKLGDERSLPSPAALH